MSVEVELKAIKKSYGLIAANHRVDLLLKPHSIHALVGENGAGKSTAMKILYGLTTPDYGQILVNGKPCPSNWNPQQARQQGIAMVHQHFMLASHQTALDNIVLGVEQTRWGFWRNRRAETVQIEKLMHETQLQVDLTKTIAELSVSQQSRCEILKALYRKAQCIILDEPTAVLTPQEISNFLKTLEYLKSKNFSILLVTHKLQEVFAVADTVTVLRQGTTLETNPINHYTLASLAEKMVGRQTQTFTPQPFKNTQQPPLFNLRTQRSELAIRPQEIIGIAGVEGNGQEEWINRIIEQGQKFNFGIIPSDRQKEGLILNFLSYENLRLKKEIFQKKNLSYFSPGTHQEQQQLTQFDVRPPNLNLAVKNFSGGNQQKIIFARELTQKRDFILACNPTRGVDIGSIEFIHHQLLQASQNGAAICIFSTELSELMALCNRIGVLYRNEICAWFDDPQKFNEKSLGLAMMGGTPS